MKNLLFLSFASLSFLAAAATPSVSKVKLEKSLSSGYEITYDLADGPAVVTLDIECGNGQEDDWRSVGSAFGVATGDVSRVVSVSSGFIAWFPSEDFSAKTGDGLRLRAKVTAWPLDNPPDYMIVSLNHGDGSACTYYEREDLLPSGGILSNMMYRTSHIPMRKIIAKDVTWTMGSTNEIMSSQGATSFQCSSDGSQNPHQVTLSENYYIAVFETTQAQLAHILGTHLAKWKQEGAMRPSDGSYSYNQLRGSNDNTTDTPEPTEASIIGQFRNRTGIDFDLPTEAQWEFACRAGHGHGFWPDGTPMVIADFSEAGAFRSPQLDNLARYVYNGGVSAGNGESGITEYGGGFGPTNATAIVGSYPPNSWGLYDMCGNMTEWCRDWYQIDITGLNGALVAQRGANNYRVMRGGAFRLNARNLRPGARMSTDATKGTTTNWVWGRAGFRLMAPCLAK